MSYFSYGNYQFDRVLTESMHLDAAPDPSGLDLAGVCVVLTITATWTADTGLDGGGDEIFQGPSPMLAGESAGVTLKRIKTDLLTPRQTLYYRPGPPTESGPDFDINDADPGDVVTKVLIDTNQEPDIAGGPLPLSCVVTHVVNASFVVSLKIKVTLAGCTDLGIFVDTASLRYSVSLDKNEKGYYTRTTIGQIVTRRDSLDDTSAARICASDAYFLQRVLRAVRMLPGWDRKIQHTVDESERVMRFHIVDTERFMTGPILKDSGGGVSKAAATYSLRYSEQFGIGNGVAVRVATAAAEVTGDPETSTASLLRCALELCYTKLIAANVVRMNAGAIPRALVIVRCDLQEDAANNGITLTMSAWLPQLVQQGIVANRANFLNLFPAVGCDLSPAGVQSSNFGSVRNYYLQAALTFLFSPCSLTEYPRRPPTWEPNPQVEA